MRFNIALQGYEIQSLADGYSPLTIRAYISSLGLMRDYLKNPDVETITEKQLKQFFGYLRTSYRPKRCDGELLSTAALHSYWKAMRSFWKWAAAELGAGRPDQCIKMPKYSHKEILPYSEAEVQQLLKACEQSAPVKSGNRKEYIFRRHTAARDKALLLLMLDTGIRPGELARLKLVDVNLESGEVQVLPHRIGKTRPRMLPIGKSTSKAIWKYLSTREAPQPDHRLFVTDQDKPISRHTIGSLVARLGKKAKVPGANPYRFRHTFAIQYLRNGGDVFTLQLMLGHATMQMVRHYLVLAERDTHEAHRRASPADNWRL